ncbi:MAG: hypothetical protein WB402_07160 [Sulfuricaulis sp.]|uniref:hypothetical protein n=1 Tax=Sulfuricaulis sp. TaxID=2003553 RepID=UPI003C3E5018
MTQTRCWLTVLTVLGGLHVGVAAAADATPPGEPIPNHPALRDPFTFVLGAYSPKTTTTALLTPSGGGSGVGVNFEDTLGLDDRNLVGFAGFRWRFTERWRMEAEYFSLSRDATRTLAADVTWGDQTFTKGATVDSTYDFSDFRLSAGYSFFKTRDKELGLGFGAHVAKMKADVNAGAQGAEGADVLAPLPVVNLYGLFALTNQWALSMRTDWLSLSYGAYSGDIRNMAIDVLYQPFRNVGFGLGTRTLNIDVSVDNTNWHGSAKMVFQGPIAFMTASF